MTGNKRQAASISKPAQPAKPEGRRDHNQMCRHGGGIFCRAIKGPLTAPAGDSGRALSPQVASV
ncbi:MAG: hypothetical protein CMH67_05595 [Nisaea sp.]|nr:hypothetical protein [Nisaea sp.]